MSVSLREALRPGSLRRARNADGHHRIVVKRGQPRSSRSTRSVPKQEKPYNIDEEYVKELEYERQQLVEEVYHLQLNEQQLLEHNKVLEEDVVSLKEVIDAHRRSTKLGVQATESYSPSNSNRQAGPVTDLKGSLQRAQKESAHWREMCKEHQTVLSHLQNDFASVRDTNKRLKAKLRSIMSEDKREERASKRLQVAEKQNRDLEHKCAVLLKTQAEDRERFGLKTAALKASETYLKEAFEQERKLRRVEEGRHQAQVDAFLSAIKALKESFAELKDLAPELKPQLMAEGPSSSETQTKVTELIEAKIQSLKAEMSDERLESDAKTAKANAELKEKLEKCRDLEKKLFELEGKAAAHASKKSEPVDEPLQVQVKPSKSPEEKPSNRLEEKPSNRPEERKYEKKAAAQKLLSPSRSRKRIEDVKSIGEPGWRRRSRSRNGRNSGRHYTGVDVDVSCSRGFDEYSDEDNRSLGESMENYPRFDDDSDSDEQANSAMEASNSSVSAVGVQSYSSSLF
mmetsp:Transcript_7711/g.14655  ORF Transcript_7711/g.14655 Transcript_7711/m.14655 type:complete len:514 (-) Transcript_7711:89-1630(-)